MVMQPSLRRMLAPLIASALIVSIAHAQSEIGPVEARAREFGRAVSAGRPEDFKQLVQGSFGGNLPNIPMPAHIAMLMSYWDQSRGLTFQRLVEPTATEALAVFRNHLTDSPSGIFIRVEPEAPHRIVAIWPLNPLRKPMPDAVRPIVSTKLNDQQIARELGAFTKRLARADVFSGVVALARDGVPVFEAAYGESNKQTHDANRLRTKFNLASMGKMFTAIAVAQLVERGRLSYEDPLAKFLPYFPDADSAKQIKIKHLLSHTAGLPMGEARPPNVSPETVDDYLAAISQPTQLRFPPGTGYQYSNIGFLVLGKVIEEVSGQSYYEYVGAHILEPAGMRDTVFEAPDPANRDVAIGYAKKFDVEGKVHFESNLHLRKGRSGPHGGAYSTIADLFRFDRALRTGNLLPLQAVQTLMTAKPDLGAAAYGFGFDVSEALGIAGHGGGFHGISNNIDFFTQNGWTAIVLSNYTVTGFEACAPIVVKIRELVADSVPAVAGIRPPPWHSNEH